VVQKSGIKELEPVRGGGVVFSLRKADTMKKVFSSAAERALCDLLAVADIQVGGTRPWDLCVHDSRFFRRALTGGTLGFGESYMDGWWDCEALDDMSCRAVGARLDERIPWNPRILSGLVSSGIFNLQTRRGARVVGRKHYDLGNAFFERMLGPDMQYSCARYGEGDDLAGAQRRKLELTCRKLGLREGLTLLDIGCGWGGLARHAARHYGCRVVGITISREQQKYAAEFCRGLPVEIRLQDYRDVAGPFDRVVSIGMLEHVGAKNYRRYLEAVDRTLEKDGLFLCQTIACNGSGMPCDPWIGRYIFPHSMLPSAARVLRAAEGIFVPEDIQNFGPDYDRTLRDWEQNFVAAREDFRDRYGERFFRMWRYYLLTCAGAFRARSLQLFQFVFSKGNRPGVYERP